jgi:hypothetical protein
VDRGNWIVSVAILVGAALIAGTIYLSRQPISDAEPVQEGPTGDAVRFQATEVHVFAPFTSKGLNPDLEVARTVTGSCFGSSSATPGRTDAWRCSDEDSRIYDPCFESPWVNQSFVACTDSPDGRVIKFEIGDPLSLPREFQSDPKGGLELGAPWVFDLVTGERCFPLGGATLVVADMRLNYSCGKDKKFPISAFGDPDRSTPIWTIFIQPDDSSLELVRVGIRSAWY